MFDLDLGGFTGKGCMRAGIEEQEPGAGVAGEYGFDALAIEPAGGFDGVGGGVDGGDVGVDDSVETVGNACGYAGETGA